MRLLTELAVSQKFISIGAPSVIQDEQGINLHLRLKGYYVEDSFKGQVIFANTEDSKDVVIFPLHPSDSRIPQQYELIIPIDEIPHCIYQILTKIHVKLVVTEAMQADWFETFKDESIVNYLTERIGEKGDLTLTKNLVSNFHFLSC